MAAALVLDVERGKSGRIILEEPAGFIDQLEVQVIHGDHMLRVELTRGHPLPQEPCWGAGQMASHMFSVAQNSLGICV